MRPYSEMEWSRTGRKAPGERSLFLRSEGGSVLAAPTNGTSTIVAGSRRSPGSSLDLRGTVAEVILVSLPCARIVGPLLKDVIPDSACSRQITGSRAGQSQCEEVVQAFTS